MKAAGDNPIDQDSLDGVWNGLTMYLERRRRESALSSVNLWNPKRMGAPATDELPSPAPTGARCCGVATTAAYAEEAIDHCRL